VRLFIAINFNDETRAKLLALRDELKSKSQRGNFSLPENLHLTLAFLGECDGKQTVTIKDILKAVEFDPFVAKIERIGRFKRDSGNIWWAGLSESNPLLILQKDLTNKLNAEGVKLDTRKYSPHITLGREVATSATPWTIEPFLETVIKIDLMKSERVNGKLIYTAIFSKEAEQCT
jgi:2'-5' RNA ligase